jgi:hypothetical protein
MAYFAKLGIQKKWSTTIFNTYFLITIFKYIVNITWNLKKYRVRKNNQSLWGLIIPFSSVIDVASFNLDSKRNVCL